MNTIEHTRREPEPPVPDLDSQFFWAGLRDHRLRMQRCKSCGRGRFPPMPTCPYCASTGAEEIGATGRGTLYSWIVVHRAFDAAFEGEVPYTLATVELAEGGRVVGRLEGVEHPRFGMNVVAVYHDHPTWTELRFSATENGE